MTEQGDGGPLPRPLPQAVTCLLQEALTGCVLQPGRGRFSKGRPLTGPEDRHRRAGSLLPSAGLGCRWARPQASPTENTFPGLPLAPDHSAGRGEGSALPDGWASPGLSACRQNGDGGRDAGKEVCECALRS